MTNRIFKLGMFAMLLSLVTGCEVIGDIFQAGMAVGIFIVVLVILLIVWLLRKFRR